MYDDFSMRIVNLDDNGAPNLMGALTGAYPQYLWIGHMYWPCPEDKDYTFTGRYNATLSKAPKQSAEKGWPTGILEGPITGGSTVCVTLTVTHTVNYEVEGVVRHVITRGPKCTTALLYTRVPDKPRPPKLKKRNRDNLPMEATPPSMPGSPGPGGSGGGGPMEYSKDDGPWEPIPLCGRSGPDEPCGLCEPGQICLVCEIPESISFTVPNVSPTEPCTIQLRYTNDAGTTYGDPITFDAPMGGAYGSVGGSPPPGSTRVVFVPDDSSCPTVTVPVEADGSYDSGPLPPGDYKVHLEVRSVRSFIMVRDSGKDIRAETKFVY